MLVFVSTNIGILKGEVVEEYQDQYRVKINNDTILINKGLCSEDDENDIKLFDDIDFSSMDESVDDLIDENLVYDPELEGDVIETKNIKEGTCMNLKERILDKLNYKRIAEEVYNILEKEIESSVLSQIDENDIAEKFAQEYSDSFIECAETIIIDSVVNDIEYSAIEEPFNDVVIENLD